jgi:hypothetical protein
MTKILRALWIGSLVALGFAAFSASIACAANLSDGGKPGLYQILGSSSLVTGATFTGSSEGSVRLLVPGRHISLLCTSVDVLEGKFLSDTSALLKLLFLNCRVKVFGEGEEEEVMGCTVTNGREITMAFIALAKKHENESYVLFEPDGTESFGTISYEAEKGCILPLTGAVTGSVVAKATPGEVVNQLLSFSKPIQELFQVGTGGDHMKYLGSDVYVDGSLSLSLTGPHLGCVFGVV